jgi:SAM-dependent methyltransferase
MQPATCALCGTNDHAVVLYPATVNPEDLNPEVFSARRLPDRVHGEILRCKKCGLVYPRQLIDPATLAALYERSKFTYQTEETYIRRTYSRYVCKAMKTLTTNRPWAYLDIGCGNGFMVEEALQLGLDEAAGIEPSEHAIASAPEPRRGRLIQGMFSADKVGTGKFDLISCFQTLDHIPDPAGFVRECMNALKPGGRVLFINHNIASWTARILGERCPMIDIEHTYLHTPDTMRQMFAQAGFTDIDVFPVRNDYPLYYWLHLVPGPKKLKTAIINILKTIGIGHVIIPFRPGNLGLIAMKR